jgi:hypothetical protein
MPKRKVIPYQREPFKTCWHPYSLQELQPRRFGHVVAQIIAGRMTLTPFIETRRKSR